MYITGAFNNCQIQCNTVKRPSERHYLIFHYQIVKYFLMKVTDLVVTITNFQIGLKIFNKIVMKSLTW